MVWEIKGSSVNHEEMLRGEVEGVLRITMVRIRFRCWRGSGRVFTSEIPSKSASCYSPGLYSPDASVTEHQNESFAKAIAKERKIVILGVVPVCQHGLITASSTVARAVQPAKCSQSILVQPPLQEREERTAFCKRPLAWL